MKKYSLEENPLKGSAEGLPKDNIKGIKPVIRLIISGAFRSFLNSGIIFKRSVLLLVFIVAALKAVAPGINSQIMVKVPGINPYSSLMYATAMVETMFNPAAYNEKEGAAGIFQIRQIRVDEYNRLTGSNYSLDDMFDYRKSEKVFLYFASQIGPYNFEKIARRWNGSGPRTELYWRRIKKYL